MLLGTLLPSARAAQAIGLMLFFPSFLLGVGGPPPEAMSDTLRNVADVLPLALANEAIREPWLGLGNGDRPAARGRRGRGRRLGARRATYRPLSPRLPAMTPRGVRLAAPAAVALFVVVGRVPDPAVRRGGAAGGRGRDRGSSRLLAWRDADRVAAGRRARGGRRSGSRVLGHEQSSNLGWFGAVRRSVAGWRSVAPVRQAAVLGAALVASSSANGSTQSARTRLGVVDRRHGRSPSTACIFDRRQRSLLEQLREAQAGLADRTRAEERNRIAGEMHDVIGHALTVSLLHVSSARLALEDDDPEEAQASLAEAERLAQQSLDEVRAAVGLMRNRRPERGRPDARRGRRRSSWSSRSAGPAPPVELDVDGDLASLGATRGLAVYRIVQESLTNAARHAAGTPVSVRIEAGRETRP